MLRKFPVQLAQRVLDGPEIDDLLEEFIPRIALVSVGEIRYRGVTTGVALALRRNRLSVLK